MGELGEALAELDQNSVLRVVQDVPMARRASLTTENEARRLMKRWSCRCVDMPS